MNTHAHHDPVAGIVPVPNGPETGDETASYPYAHNADNEKAIFAYLLHPDDSYNAEGTYWADMPLVKRVGFVMANESREASKELSAIGAMMKKDPLSPIGWYFRNAVLPGAGLGLEGYVLFSIGNLSSIFSAVWPTCWGTFTECNHQWVNSVTYLEVLGIIVGQILVGITGDWIGRRWGLIQDAIIMFIGLLWLTASWGLDLNQWVACYAFALFFYGIGVGGEYPMTATAAMENAIGSGKVSTREDRLHRGRKVTMAFLMQGWGQVANQIVLILLLIIFHHGSGNPPYSTLSVQWTFRVSFALPAVGTLWLVYYRWYKMPAASVQLEASKRKTHVTGYDVASLRKTVTIFGGRLLATAGTWFCNDVFFYGNKLFQSQFIKVISPHATVVDGWLWNLVNVFVSLAGYYLASFMIDNKLYGRKMMMQIGFGLDFILFIIPATHYHHYSSAAGIHSFQAMYFLSSFFNQFGPNSVTFLVAAEVFPTKIRATAHGFSAAVGKLGALLAAVVYNYITKPDEKFYFVPWFGLVGMILTFLFLPDTTGLDLKEQERRWEYIMAGRAADYHGVAVHPQHLSLWERVRGVGKAYNPQLDYQAKIDDMRRDWANKVAEKQANEGEIGSLDDDEYTTEVQGYFARNSPVIQSKEMMDEKHGMNGNNSSNDDVKI